MSQRPSGPSARTIDVILNDAKDLSTRVIRAVRDPSLPDHASWIQSEPPTGRVIVIAPTRAACETIELAVQLHIDTFLEVNHGPRVRDLARAGRGFGIVAGTGTGKTLAIRPIAEEILGGAELKVAADVRSSDFAGRVVRSGESVDRKRPARVARSTGTSTEPAKGTVAVGAVGAAPAGRDKKVVDAS